MKYMFLTSSVYTLKSAIVIPTNKGQRKDDQIKLSLSFYPSANETMNSYWNPNPRSLPILIFLAYGTHPLLSAAQKLDIKRQKVQKFQGRLFIPSDGLLSNTLVTPVEIKVNKRSALSGAKVLILSIFRGFCT